MSHVLHVHTTICRKCSKAYTTSTLYQIAELRPGYRHLVPAHEHPPYRPEIVTLPVERILACHECAPSLPADPKPIDHWIPLSWRARERELMTSIVKQAATQRAAKSALPTSDDLI